MFSSISNYLSGIRSPNDHFMTNYFQIDLKVFLYKNVSLFSICIKENWLYPLADMIFNRSNGYGGTQVSGWFVRVIPIYTLRHMAAMFYNSENLLGHLRTICTKFYWNRTKRHLQTIYVEGIVQIWRIKCPKIRSFQISKMAVMTVVCSYFLNYFKWHLISNHMLDWTETCGYTKIYNCYMAWNDPVEIRKKIYFLKAI